MPSLLQSGKAILRAPAIEIGFALRSLLRWSRGAPKRPEGAAVSNFDWADPKRKQVLEQREAVLHERYRLAGLGQALTPELRCHNLARLEQLESLADSLEMPCGPDGVVRAADFGCGDFYYAAALSQWLSRHGEEAARPVVLRGLEVDGHGIYRDGHSRADHARARAQAASDHGCTVRFEIADAAYARLPQQDVVSMFFPFLTAYACLTWGTPLSRLKPRKLLERAVRSLRPGGWLVVANQTPEEYLILSRLLARLPVVRIARTSFATDLVPDSERTEGQIGSLWLRQE